MPEISKPSQTVHWLVTDGTILHAGTTKPNQVTSTGLPTLEQAPTQTALLAKLKPHVDNLPALPNKGIAVHGEYYKDAGNPVFIKQTHDRAKPNEAHLERGV